MKTRKFTKAALYDAITEQGLVLPKIKSSICNMEYLVRVKNFVEYCPKAHEVPNLTCPAPPKKIILLCIIQEELEKKGDPRVLSFDEKHQPDVDWCLHAISALNPQHQIFDPYYEPSKSQRGRRGIRYIPKAEDFEFAEEVDRKGNGNENENVNRNRNENVNRNRNLNANPVHSKSHLNTRYNTQQASKDRNVSFRQHINHFDLSLDESVPYVNIQDNEYCSTKKNYGHF